MTEETDEPQATETAAAATSRATAPQFEIEDLIDDPPGGGDEYALVEVSLDFPLLDMLMERHALWARLFILTRDPLGWIADRGHAWAVANTTERMVELIVYVELEELQRQIADGAELAEALGRFGETAMRRAFEHELLLSAGESTPLLEGLDGYEARFGVPEVHVRSQGWEAVGLGAVKDLVGDAFGSVALDTTAITLPPVDAPDEDCPACDGLSFAFPGGLDEAGDEMCEAHREAAVRARTERLARAHESNPAGWKAIDKAAARMSGEREPVFAPQPKRTVTSVSRNDPCPCGSGKKYKKCHGA